MDQFGYDEHPAPDAERQQRSAKRTARAVGYVGVILIPFVSFLLGLTVGYNQARQDAQSWYGPSGSGSIVSGTDNEGPSGAPKINLGMFWETLSKVETMYVTPSKVDYAKMAYGAIRGMLATLDDPYTSFMSPEESREFSDALNGDLEGIGAELSERDGHLVVVTPIRGTPAERAGLMPGDVIYKIDGEPATNFTLTEAVSRIRGKPGTKVALTIIRGEGQEPFDLAIERQAIKVPSVEIEHLDAEYAHISILQFGNDTLKEFNRAVNQILIRKPRGIVIDLRNNGGGYLDAAIDLASEFIDRGVVTTVRKRLPNGTWTEEVDRVSGNARLSDIPLVVLVNEGSASASEIFAGAIRDHRRGRLVGQKTFGKGTVQDLVSLSDGSTLRITTAEWFTPDNVNVTKVGLTPDVVVEAEPQDPTKAQDAPDRQLEKAIELLKNPPNP